MTDHGDAEDLAGSVRARVAAATSAGEIQDLADAAIDRIRMLADEAQAKARQVDELMRQLSELLEQDRGDGEQDHGQP